MRGPCCRRSVARPAHADQVLVVRSGRRPFEFPGVGLPGACARSSGPSSAPGRPFRDLRGVPGADSRDPAPRRSRGDSVSPLRPHHDAVAHGLTRPASRALPGSRPPRAGRARARAGRGRGRRRYGGGGVGNLGAVESSPEPWHGALARSPSRCRRSPRCSFAPPRRPEARPLRSLLRGAPDRGESSRRAPTLRGGRGSGLVRGLH